MNVAIFLFITESLVVTDGAQAANLTFSDGNAGNLNIKAKNIELVGTSPNGFPSSFLTNADVGSTGKGGNLIIETDRLFVADGAQILSSTFGDGNAGNLTVKAKNLELVGTSAYGFPSQISASVEPFEEEAKGNGGNLTIETEKLQVRDGAQIAVATAGSGNAGTMQVRAKEIELIGGSDLASSGIFASAIIGTGNGGELDIASDRLSIKDGATISTSNFASRDSNIPPGQGKAGNIKIETGTLQLDNTSSIVPSSITASTNSAGGGNIIINAQNSLIARNNSQMSAETKGKGNGGDIQVTTDFFNLINNAQITTNSEGLGQAGKITVKAGQINLDRGQITATSVQSGGGDINLAIDRNLMLGNNSLISTSVLDSTGGGGNINIDDTLLVAFNNSDIRANAVLGAGGRIQITTEGLFQSADSDISASSQFGVDGIVSIINPEVNNDFGLMPLPNKTIAPNQKVTTACSIQPINSLVIAGRGGLPENPRQTLRNKTTWTDLRLFQSDRVAPFSDINSQKSSVSESMPNFDGNSSLIVEAQGWIVDDRGNVHLLAASPHLNFKDAWQPLDRCY